MKRLQYTFTTTLAFSAPVWEHQLALRCVPVGDGVQKIERCTPTLTPGALPPPQRDGFGNTVYWCSIVPPHQTLQYGSSGVVTVDFAAGQNAPPPNPALKFPGLRTGAGPSLWQAYSAAPQSHTPLAFAAALCGYVHGLLQYQPGATNTRTTAEQALALGRGVCQDYAHIYLVLARRYGLPARYCMGLTVGEGATHAWAEVYAAGAWHGFDPTRNQVVDESYLRFATARDAADCPVEQGTFWGNADQTQTVYMRVSQAEETK